MKSKTAAFGWGLCFGIALTLVVFIVALNSAGFWG